MQISEADPSKTTVVVGMSGGVDSSVSALLLKNAGYKVIGMFMKNWEEIGSDGVCHAAQDAEDAAAVCHALAIPFYAVSFCKEYMDRVFEQFLAELSLGFTPNPDILCNREIKFRTFLERAIELGGDFLATGHYCRKALVDDQWHLLRGLDESKDQSYFVYTLTAAKLKQTLFPVGDLPKSEVRRLAREAGLPTAAKKDSTGICFIGKRNFKEFVSQYLPYHKGEMQTPSGKVVGYHDGVAYYTIGQRKGLGVGGAGEAWFVAGKQVERNVLIVVQGADHPALYKKQLLAKEASWVANPPTAFPFRCSAKIRYRQPDALCTIVTLDKDQLQVVFDEPQKAITPSQAIVFYQGELCLGGASILHAID